MGDKAADERELQEFMTRYQAGDIDALEQLVRQISPPLLRYFAASPSDRSDAKDLCRLLDKNTPVAPYISPFRTAYAVDLLYCATCAARCIPQAAALGVERGARSLQKSAPEPAHAPAPSWTNSWIRNRPGRSCRRSPRPRQVSVYPRTDDAEVFANLIGIAPEVEGRIIKIPVRDNQFVKKGDLLFQIDPIPYQYALDTAESQQAELEGQIRDLERVIGSQNSGVLSAKANRNSSQAKMAASGAAAQAAQASIVRTEGLFGNDSLLCDLFSARLARRCCVHGNVHHYRASFQRAVAAVFCGNTGAEAGVSSGWLIYGRRDFWDGPARSGVSVHRLYGIHLCVHRSFAFCHLGSHFRPAAFLFRPADCARFLPHNPSGFTVGSSLATSRDRVAGIWLALFVMWIVFDNLWVTQMQEASAERIV